MTVNFWTFSKRLNSTAVPAGTPLKSYTTAYLKDESGVLSPVIQIQESSTFNPAAYNYAYISDFSRYYFVGDWVYSGGLWNAQLTIDVLASHKTEIGNLSKYVVRSSHSFTLDCVDDFYPPLAAQPTHWSSTDTFLFSQNFSSGMYVLGVACNDSSGAGAITYYTMTASQIRDLVNYMLTPTSGWNNGFTGMTDVLYRSVYNPFDYIKSCRWFPISYFGLVTQDITFGNFTSTARGQPLQLDASLWPSDSADLTLPSNWLTLEGKYRSNPYAHIYIVLNPWGVMELNPLDLSDTIDIKLRLYPDFISGDCLLKIFKVVNNVEYFLTEKMARLAVDINLSASSINLLSAISGAAGAVGAVAGAFMGAPLTSLLSLAGSSGAQITAALTPSASASVGQTIGGARAMEGVATLILTETAFADSNNNEFGRPLYKTKTLSSIPGFIKCADAEHDVTAYESEKQEIGNYLEAGFFYE